MKPRNLTALLTQPADFLLKMPSYERYGIQRLEDQGNEIEDEASTERRRNVAIATTAAVDILKRTEFAALAAICLLAEAASILVEILLLKCKKESPLTPPL